MSWISLPKAAELMGMTESGARRRLKRINEKLGGRLLRRFGRDWEVCTGVLDELKNEVQREQKFDDLEVKLQELDLKLLVLRNAHKNHKKAIDSRLSQIQSDLNGPLRT